MKELETNEQTLELVKLVNDLQRQQDLLERLEKEQEVVKKRVRDLSTKAIPDMMENLGLEAFTTKHGIKVTIKPFYSVTIPEDQRAAAYEWLVENNFGDIVKAELNVLVDAKDRVKVQQFRAKLEKAGVPFVEHRAVHPQTLKAWAKELVEDGKKLPPEEMFNVYIGKVTKLEI